MALPVAAIVCIVLACWVVVVFALFGLYKFLKYRGSCDCDCAPCGREGGENTCCKSLSEACNCCNPSVQGCLNSACPKKKISCVDIILCQCCAEPGQDSCLVNTFSCCSCNCCSDGCCTCCVDCDPLICCCLEIRLVSRSESPLKEPNAVKYTVRTQSAQNHNKEPNNIEKSKVDLTKDNKGHEKKINYEKKSVKIPHSSRSDRSDKSVTSPRSLNSGTPRSVSQLQVSCTPSSGKKRRTGKPSSKLKSGTLKPQLDRKLLSGARSLPSPPALPSRSQTSDHVSDDNSGSRERNSSESSAGELVEIPVEQQNVYLQSDLYKNTQLKKNSHLSPDLILGLPLGDHGASDSFPQGASSANVNQSSSVSMRPGTILDGSMSHRDGFRHSRDGSSSYRDGSISYRSVVSGSNISVHFDGQQKAGVMNLTSPRPLPGPPMR